MKSISILGCGWLGLSLGKQLAASGLLVKGSTTRDSKRDILKSSGIEPFVIRLSPNLEGNWEGFFDSDVLLINIPPRNKDGIQGYHESQLKAIIQAADSKMGHVIFISSTSVYPSNNKTVSEKDASPSSLTRGGISLLTLEQLFNQNNAFDTTVIRFGGLYGPDRHPGNFLTGKKDLPGAHNPINMIHLDDCIGIIQTIIEKNIWGEVFNACSPSHQNRQSFYQAAADDLGVPAPTFSAQEAPFKKVSSEKWLNITGYQFKH